MKEETLREKVEAIMEYLGANVEEGTKEVLELIEEERAKDQAIFNKALHDPITGVEAAIGNRERQRIREAIEKNTINAGDRLSPWNVVDVEELLKAIDL